MALRRQLRVLVVSSLCRFMWALWSDGDLGVGNNGKNVTTNATFPLPTNATADCYAACLARSDCSAWQVRFASSSCGPAASCTLKADYGGDGSSTYLGARVPCYLDPCAASGPVAREGSPLQPLAFTPARLADVTPQGWLADELAAQAATGQTGQLALFWAPVSESIWLGGKADGYLHEDAPCTVPHSAPAAVFLLFIGFWRRP